MNQSPSDIPLPNVEHRLVTILFTDIVGSTALTSEVGSETSRLIFDRCLRIMSLPIDEFGGTVTRLMGDGLLAFFGAPTSHEDDPERATLAALKIHEAIIRYGRELNIPLQVRIGITTGRVVMGEVGGETLSEYTAMGEPINLAARLQSSAESGTTLIDETTCRLITHRFETQTLPPIKLKGFEEKIPVFQLLKLRDHADPARGIPGRISPLIGREKELDKLVSHLEELHIGRGAIVSLIGEPGVGKSRLLHEARQEVADAAITWAQGQASSYAAGQPFGVIRDLLGALLKVSALDTPAMIDLKIEKELTPLFDQRLGEIWPSIANLLGAPVPPQYADRLEGLEPEALNRSMTTAFCQLVEALAGKQPMVLGFDDLHWADPSSLSLLEALFLITERAPLLIVLLFRPDHESRIWELKNLAERDFGHRYLGLTLESLTKSESRQLTSNLTANDDLPGKLHELLLEKSAGNPFFLEELLQDLMESDTFEQKGDAWVMSREIQHLRVPETLQEVIQARVDRIPAPERQTLQAAAVIGKRFGFQLLETVSPGSEELPTHLLTLQRADLIREWSRQPEPTYIFKQSAVQEVTYQQLVADQRRDLHQRVAQSLEVMFAEQLEEHAAMLAHHFSLAENENKALHYHRMAGNNSLKVNANIEAAEHYTRAIELAQDHAEISMDELGHLYLSLGRVYELLAQYERALDVYDQLREVADRRGEPKVGLRARLAKNTLRVTPTPLFDAEMGRRMSEEALQLAREWDDPEAEAKTLWHMGLLGRLTGQDDEAVKLFEQSLAIAEEYDFEEQIGFTLTDLYWSYLVLEHVDKSRETVDRAHEIWSKRENLPMMVDTLAGRVFVLFLAGEYTQAIETSKRALEISEKIDNLWGKSYSQSYLGFAYLELGEISTAFETAHRSIALGNQAGFFVPGVILPPMEALTRARMGGRRSNEPLISETTPENFKRVVAPLVKLIEAEIHVYNNDLDQAKTVLDESSVEPSLMTSIHLEFPPEVTQAIYAEAAGQYDHVIEITTEAIDNLSERGVVCHLPSLYCLRARAYTNLGNNALAMEDVQLGLELTVKSGARWPTWQLLALRSQLRSDAGDTEAAVEDLRSAAELVNYIAEHVREDELRASFLAKPEVEAILKSGT